MRLDNGNPIICQKQSEDHKQQTNQSDKLPSYLQSLTNLRPARPSKGSSGKVSDALDISPKHLEASRSIFSSQCMQNRRTAIWQTQTFISSKDIYSSRHQNLGGAERDRTADPLLAKQVLSQLSYSPIQVSIPDRLATQSLGWWARADSNCRPHAYQACALTT